MTTLNTTILDTFGAPNAQGNSFNTIAGIKWQLVGTDVKAIRKELGRMVKAGQLTTRKIYCQVARRPVNGWCLSVGG